MGRAAQEEATRVLADLHGAGQHSASRSRALTGSEWKTRRGADEALPRSTKVESSAAARTRQLNTAGMISSGRS